MLWWCSDKCMYPSMLGSIKYSYALFNITLVETCQYKDPSWKLASLLYNMSHCESLRISCQHRESYLDMRNSCLDHRSCPTSTIFFGWHVIPGYSLDAITSCHITDYMWWFLFCPLGYLRESISLSWSHGMHRNIGKKIKAPLVSERGLSCRRLYTSKLSRKRIPRRRRSDVLANNWCITRF
jgi:hypothetical protein